MGGVDVGAFTAALNTPLSPVVTNAASLAAVTRSQGMTITWSGGSAGSLQISGGGYSCTAQVSDGEFTVPGYVLNNALPGANYVSLTFVPNLQFFTAQGLDVAYTFMSPSSPAGLSVTFQ